MKIKITYEKHFGKEVFYPYDKWTREFLSVFRAQEAKSFSRRQIDMLKKLGFEIEDMTEII